MRARAWTGGDGGVGSRVAVVGSAESSRAQPSSQHSGTERPTQIALGARRRRLLKQWRGQAQYEMHDRLLYAIRSSVLFPDWSVL